MEPPLFVPQWPYQVLMFFKNFLDMYTLWIKCEKCIFYSATLCLGVKFEKSLKFGGLKGHTTFRPLLALRNKSIIFLHILSCRGHKILHSQWSLIILCWKLTVLWAILLPPTPKFQIFAVSINFRKRVKIGGFWKNIFIHPPWAGVPPYVQTIWGGCTSLSQNDFDFVILGSCLPTTSKVKSKLLWLQMEVFFVTHN